MRSTRQKLFPIYVCITLSIAWVPSGRASIAQRLKSPTSKRVGAASAALVLTWAGIRTLSRTPEPNGPDKQSSIQQQALASPTKLPGGMVSSDAKNEVETAKQTISPPDSMTTALKAIYLERAGKLTDWLESNASKISAALDADSLSPEQENLIIQLQAKLAGVRGALSPIVDVLKSTDQAILLTPEDVKRVARLLELYYQYAPAVETFEMSGEKQVSDLYGKDAVFRETTLNQLSGFDLYARLAQVNPGHDEPFLKMRNLSNDLAERHEADIASTEKYRALDSFFQSVVDSLAQPSTEAAANPLDDRGTGPYAAR